ncbi:MAG: thermonuclease family protein [Pseudomonadota bacterium]|nr:thermonuclease family protein [Pseudomonadota bacterium]
MRKIAGLTVAVCCFAAIMVFHGRAPVELPLSPLDGIPERKPPGEPATADREGAGPEFEPVRRDIRDVTPDHVLPAPQLDQAVIERLPASAPPPPPARPAQARQWRHARVKAPGRLVSGETEILIAGIEPLASDAECTIIGGKSWPCGNHARAALRRLVRQRPVECDPFDEPEGRLPAVTRCRIDGRDIGEWLVERGWAVPKAGSDYGPALDRARKAGLGQWRRRRPAGLAAVTLPAIEAEDSGGPVLLAPGITAEEALVPLEEPVAIAPAVPPNDPDVAPPEPGGLDR